MIYKIAAFVRRDFRTQASYRLDFLLRIASIFISIAIFYFISQILGAAVNPYLGRYGADYFHFALLGIAFYPFINLSTDSLSDAIHEYQHSGTLEVLFVSPTPILPALLMSTVWGYCWAVAEVLFYLLAAALIFRADLNWANILAALLVVVLTVLANAGLGLVNAAFVLATKRTSPLARLLGLFTSLLAGIYFPVEVLPAWLRVFSHLLPATYAFDAVRRLLLQPVSLADLAANMLILVGFTLLLLPLGLIAFYYAVQWSKVDGSLAQY